MTMSCLEGRLLVLVHQKQENFRTVLLERRLMKACEEKVELAAKFAEVEARLKDAEAACRLHSLHRLQMRCTLSAFRSLICKNL